MPSRRKFLVSCTAGITALSGCLVNKGIPISNPNPSQGTEELSVKWSTNINYPYTTPTIIEDRVFVGTEAGIIGFDLSQGTTNWRALASGKTQPAGKPAVKDGIIYVTDDDRYGEGPASVRAFDLNTGEQRWRTKVGDGSVFAPTITGNHVYVRSENAFHILDATDGEQLLRIDDLAPFETEGYDVSNSIRPAVSGDVVLVPHPSAVSAITVDEGTELWTTPIEKVRASPTIDGGTAYLSGVTTGVVAVDLQDGSERWTWYDGGCWGSPMPFDGAMYVTGNDLVSLDTNNGHRRWSWEAPSDLLAAPTIDDGLLVSVTIGETMVFELNQGENVPAGVLAQRSDIGSYVSPAIEKNRIVVVENGTLTCLTID